MYCFIIEKKLHLKIVKKGLCSLFKAKPGHECYQKCQWHFKSSSKEALEEVLRFRGTLAFRKMFKYKPRTPRNILLQ